MNKRQRPSDLYDKSIKIRLAPTAEALEILSEPQIVERIGHATKHLNKQPWIAERAGAKLLFVFHQLSKAGIYEMHIACPLASIRASRILASAAMDWLYHMGADVIVTSCPEGKIANMARKLEFVELTRTPELIYFMKQRC